MTLNRRSFLAGASGLAMSPVLAQEAPPVLATYERETGGRIGLHAENLVTGAKITWRAEERFVMCSTFKASLAAFVLSRVDRGQDRLEDMIAYGPQDILDYAPVAKQNLTQGTMSVFDMCKAAVELSDNTCANLLLARSGGPAALTAFWRSTGDSVTRLDHNEPELNRSPPGDPHDTTTPAAMAGNLRRFLLGAVLSPDSRENLTAWITGCVPSCPRTGRSATRPSTMARTRAAISLWHGQTPAVRCWLALTRRAVRRPHSNSKPSLRKSVEWWARGWLSLAWQCATFQVPARLFKARNTS